MQVILPAILCAAMAAAQTAPASPAPTTPVAAPASSNALPSPVATGAIISAQFSKSLDARKNRVGDRIEAKTTVDLLAHGKIVLPRNTKITGQVTAVKVRTKASPDSSVAIAFDRLILKDGTQLPIHLVVQAIGRPLESLFSDEDSQGEPAGNLPPIGTSAPRATVMGSPAAGQMPGAQYPAPSHSESAAANLPGDAHGLSSSPPLGPASQGAVGLKGISLTSAGLIATISSSTRNVHLDGNSQVLLKAQ